MTKQEIEDKLQEWQDKRDDIADIIVEKQKELNNADAAVKCLLHMLEIAKLKEDRLPADWVI